MSKAGIQSNRGDGYQTLVAFDWALHVLSDPDYSWLEIDSTSTSVDDVVVGRFDGVTICCQCKKNQQQHNSWSFTDLRDELCKAIDLLGRDRHAQVRFYSRSPFGELSALREHSSIYPDDMTSRSYLPKWLRAIDNNLRLLILERKTNLSVRDFLQRSAFEVTPALDAMRDRLQERLKHLVSNHLSAYQALWTSLDLLGMRESAEGLFTVVKHRLTKQDLRALVDGAGSVVTPPVDITTIRHSFRHASAIGRSWRRDIGNQRVTRPAVKEILSAIESGQSSILLTGAPGSGKTCVLLDVQDELESLHRPGDSLVPLYVQAREFADLPSIDERDLQGLPGRWVEWAARMAESARVVIVIDSLDVLSIAREHSVLTYFLAQLDRLLVLPNVTVVTSCREFDLRYDRRIAQRRWDVTITCDPLDWQSEIVPLLTSLGIDSSTVDKTTRELVSNPLELGLFVELAKRNGSFNVVTSQALAQRYLATVVQADRALGDNAMRAIEELAMEMLQHRLLSIPQQRFSASEDIRRALLSSHVLHVAGDVGLTFGHQTLLDVLVISRAVRGKVALKDFIKNLPAVPFVRPSIRSFVGYLAAGDRLEFRKQLRSVLTGDYAFHIRRLAAETFAEAAPCDDDWPLLRDLRDQRRDVFQVIYERGRRFEWHRFWLKNLVPVLVEGNDAPALRIHAGRISQWKDEDLPSVIRFWDTVLDILDGEEQLRAADTITHAIADIRAEGASSCGPLLHKLLKLPRPSHSRLGHALAKCLKHGGLSDDALWDYIAGDISDADVMSHNLNDKLNCEPHDFSNGHSSFLADRMRMSTGLLDLAVTAIEGWSAAKQSQLGSALWNGFLSNTSHHDLRSQFDHRHVDSVRILFDAVQAAVEHHAKANSMWWELNRVRLCYSTEASLQYFAIMACTAAPESNLEDIAALACSGKLLESDLSYEIGNLIQAAFVYLAAPAQDAIQASILAMHNQATADEPQLRMWRLLDQAKLILAVPLHLRLPQAQVILEECEQSTRPLSRSPDITSSSGTVSAPFSFEIFLSVSDLGILRLLNHYAAYRVDSYDDFFIGGEREVGWQLYEAASRQPARFLKFLVCNWSGITERFRGDLLDGTATYLARRYGNLKSDSHWMPVEEPPAEQLADDILDELRRHWNHWRGSRAAAKALESCAHVVVRSDAAEQLAMLAIDFAGLEEQTSMSGDSRDLLTTGINMSRGNAADAVMILAVHLSEEALPWPVSLERALRAFASDVSPAVRAVFLRRMPSLLTRKSEVGWVLFELSMKAAASGLWRWAEPCLYYSYHSNFSAVRPWLTHIHQNGHGSDLETWGRISALAVLSGHVEMPLFLTNLRGLETPDAWHGAASVWAHPKNLQRHRELCLTGLAAGLDAKGESAGVVARRLSGVFRETEPPFFLPVELIQQAVNLLGLETASPRSDIFGWEEWLNAVSTRDPIYALRVLEIYVEFQRNKPYVYDYKNNLTQLLTRLFAHAEENEVADGGTTLQRVVAMQDALLTLGINGVDDWLRAAERP